jgi:hypothetical protein
VLPQQVADHRSVAVPDRRVVGDDSVTDDEGRVVGDAGSDIDCTDDVVDLLARRPRLRRAEAQPLVERPDSLDHAAAEEESG